MTDTSLTCHLILCDWAEVVGGKLYLQGGGWTGIKAGVPAQIALGLVIGVPFDLTNTKHRGEIRLLTGDGAPYPQPTGFQVDFEFEIGRPPGLPHGASQNVPLATKITEIHFLPGRYAFEVEVDGKPVARESLTAAPA